MVSRGRDSTAPCALLASPWPALCAIPGVGPVSPTVQVVRIRDILCAAVDQPLARFRDQFLLALQSQLAYEHTGPQEDEIGVEYVTATVFVDFRKLSVVEQILHHVALDGHLARFAEQVRGQIQTAMETGGAKIGQQVVQVEMRLGVVPVAALLVSLDLDVEPSGHADAVPKCGQLHERQVEAAAVERDPRRSTIRFPTAPEMFRDDVRAKRRLVQRHQIEQSQIIAHLGNHHRHRDLKSVRNKVRVRLLEQLLAIEIDRRTRLQVPVWIPQFCHQVAVRNTLDVKHQITDRLSPHGYPLFPDKTLRDDAS